MTLVLADALADRLQGFAQGTGGFAFAFTGVDLNPLHPQLAGAVMLVGAHFRMEIRQIHQGTWCPSTGGDHLETCRFSGQRSGHLLHIQQAQIKHGVQLIEHHHGIQLAGQGPAGDVPAPLRLEAIKTGDLLGGEKVTPPGAHLIDQVGKALLQGFNRSIF